GIRAADWGLIHQLRKKLQAEPFNFQGGQREHELVHKASHLRVDLVPFGGLEKDGHIQWPDTEFEMNVVGYSDAHDNAVQIELAPDLRLPVATLPALVAMKILTVADRDTDRDLPDVLHVSQNYVIDGREGEFFEEPLSSLIDEAFDWQHAGALLLGYDMKR